MYKVYANNKKTGYEKLRTTPDKQEAFDIVTRLTAKDYYSYMIVENNEQGDNIIAQENLYEEVKIEFVDNLKTSIEIKAAEFKTSRTKKKEELRKLKQDYIDR